MAVPSPTAARTARVSSKRVRALPYLYDGRGLHSRLDTVLLDAYALPLVEVDETRLDDHRLDAVHQLDLTEHTWQRLRVEGRVGVSRSLLERLAPPDELDSPPFGVVVVLRCEATRLRRAVVAEPVSGAVAGDHVFGFDLERAYLRGRLELTPYLVRTAALAADSARFARLAGARVAAGRTWRLRIDAAPPRTTQHLVDVRFTRFAESPYELLRAARDTLYLLEVDLEQPVVWLNEDHPELAELLASDATTGVAARMREVIFDRITAQVWSQLFVHSVLDVDEDGETMYPWGAPLLDELLEALLPELDGPEARRLHALETRHEPGELCAMLQRLDTLLQARDDTVVHLQRLLDEASRATS